MKGASKYLFNIINSNLLHFSKQLFKSGFKISVGVHVAKRSFDNLRNGKKNRKIFVDVTVICVDYLLSIYKQSHILILSFIIF